MHYLHTMVRARDLDQTLDFYCGKLGLVEIERYDSEAGRFTLVFLAAPGDTEKAGESNSPLLEITWNWDPEEYDEGRNFGHLAYEVDDIYATCERLMTAGVTPLTTISATDLTPTGCEGSKVSTKMVSIGGLSSARKTR